MMNALTTSVQIGQPIDSSKMSILRRAVTATASLVFGRLLPNVAYPVVRGPLRGCRYILGATAGPAGGVSVHFGRQEIEQLDCLRKLLAPGDVFIDVGANVGLYTLLGSRLVQSSGRVVAFEPMPRNIGFLQRHIDLNAARNVTILPLACADRSGREIFCDGANNALGHLADERESGTMVVATVTLDEIVAQLDLTPTVVKIDVEGAEMRVLRGASQLLGKSRPALLLSVHSDNLRSDCLEFLALHRYEARALNGDGTEFIAIAL
jgi:FkbM family methyltransferase